MEFKSQSPTTLRVRRSALFLLVLWIGLHAVWRLLDNTPPRGDQTFYTNGAVRVQEIVRLPISQWSPEFNDVTGTRLRPPGASLLLAPWLSVFQNNLRLAGLGAVLWHALTFLILYLLGKRLFDGITGLTAAVFSIGLPLIYDTYIDPEFYFISLLPLVLFCCTYLWDEKAKRWFWGFLIGATVAFALLMKWVFAIYLLGPIAFLGVKFIQHVRRDDKKDFVRDVLIPFALTAAPVALVALCWYWPNREALAEAFRDVSATRQFTPFKDGWTWRALFHYATEWFQKNKLFPSLFLAAGFIVPFLPLNLATRIGLNAVTKGERKQHLFLLSSLAGTWLYFCIRPENVPVKYIFALMPVCALLATAWIRAVSNASIKNFLYSAILVYGAFCAVWMHFAPLSWIGTSKLPRAVSIDPQNAFVRYTVPLSQPPQSEAWPQSSLVETIARLERETPLPLDSGDAIEPAIVAPDLYFFDWRNTGVEMRLHGLDLDASSLPNRIGLLRLATARYIATTRGQVTRFGYNSRDETSRNSLALNRLIDDPPQWFWKQYRLAARFDMPYGLSEIQLYRRIRPIDEEEAEGLCEFWLSFHQGDADAWDQAAKVWAMARNRQRTKRAIDIHTYLKNPKNRDVLDRVRNNPDLQPYERLELGEPSLKQCAQGDSICSWKASWMLGERYLEQKQFEEAERCLLGAWRLQRERPEIIESLVRLSRMQNDAQQTAFYRQILQRTVELLGNNRRPIVYQKTANFLLSKNWNEDALWYAYRGFAAGLNRYNNTMPLHTALQRTNRIYPNYETLLLPYERATSQKTFNDGDSISLKTGDSYVFSFLNLDGGLYRLSWNPTLNEPSALLAFTLDEKPLEPKTFNRNVNPDGGEYVFESPIWGDRLRVDCIRGEVDLSDVSLRRIETTVPFIEWDGSANVVGKNFSDLTVDPEKGASFKTNGDWVRLNFSIHSDPRAWDALRVESTGLETQSATFTIVVHDGGNEEKEISFERPLKNDPGQAYCTVPLPAELKQYPFMLGLRVQLEGLTARRPSIQRITLQANSK